MRRTFRRWLTLFMAIAFMIAVGIAYIAQSNLAATSADELIGQRVVDVRLRIDDYIVNSARANSNVDSRALAAAHSVSLILENDSSLLTDQTRIEEVATDLGVDEIVITDENGIIVASQPTSSIGFDMNTSEQSSAFMGATKYADFKLVQPFQAQGRDANVQVKYAGVARIDQPGIVQVGLYDINIRQMMSVVDFSNVAEGLTLGENGQVFIADGDTIVSASSPVYEGMTLTELGIDANAHFADSSGYVIDLDGEESRLQSSAYKGYTIVASLPTTEIYISRNHTLLIMVAFIALLFCVTFVLVSQLVQRLVINGIFSVNGSLSRITHGNLDEQIEVRSSPEFATLSDGINSTVESLKDHIAAEASRIDADLALAHAIQLGNLQTVFPAFPGHDEFDLFAHMTPAREVGGDFYDMFMPDDDHLICVMADVSGKGIPAAMFMMEAKSYINSLALGCASLSEVFERANDKLCANNDAGLFVTAFIIELDIRDGHFSFVNAGHNPPIICHTDGSCEYLPCKPGFVLGGLEGIHYRSGQGMLEKGERFVAYTDGVTEALNEEEELYGEQRLIDFLDHKNDVDVQALVEALECDLLAYRGIADQADDITILVLEYHGREQAEVQS